MTEPRAGPPSRYLDKLMVRMPDGLRARIVHAAKLNRRSMNQEVVLILLRALGDDNDATGAGLPTSTPAASHNNAVFEHGAHQPG